jgi:hypothetical protein
MIRPVRSSNSVYSPSATPMPMTIPPRSWLVAVFELMLDDTVEFFNLVLGLKLLPQEKKDLVAFMRAL